MSFQTFNICEIKLDTFVGYSVFQYYLRLQNNTKLHIISLFLSAHENKLNMFYVLGNNVINLKHFIYLRKKYVQEIIL